MTRRRRFRKQFGLYRRVRAIDGCGRLEAWVWAGQLLAALDDFNRREDEFVVSVLATIDGLPA